MEATTNLQWLLNLLLQQLMTANVGGSLALSGIYSETFAAASYAVEGSNNVLIQFTSKLISIAERTIPKTRGELKMRQKSWFNVYCKSAIRNRRAALKTFLRNPSQSNLESIRIVRTKARRTIRIEERQLEVVYVETEFKYTDEEGMGNGKTHHWQIATFNHPSSAGE
jgi:hypothetical protein